MVPTLIIFIMDKQEKKELSRKKGYSFLITFLNILILITGAGSG